MKKYLLILLVCVAATFGSITTTNTRISYATDNLTTAFTFPFPIISTSDMVVVLRDNDTGEETDLVLVTDYAVSAVNNDFSTGGTVTTVSTFASGNTLLLLRDVPDTQQTTLSDSGVLRLASLEDAYDKLTMLVQQLQEQLDRTFLIPKTDSTSIENDVPNSVNRASKNFGWDSSGNVVATAVASTGSVSFGAFGTDMAATATAAAAQTLLNLDDGTVALDLLSLEADTIEGTTSIETDLLIAKEPWVDVTHTDFGATGDGATDDTVALQAALDFAATAGNGNNASVYFPPGTYMFSNLTIAANVSMFGDSFGNCILMRITGSTGTGIEDEGNAAKINIHDLQINGNSTSGVLLKLGFTAPWGTAGKLTNLWLREAPEYALQVTGNVGFIDTVACSGTGTNKSKALITGTVNLVTRLTHQAAAAASAVYGIEIESVNSTFTHTHCEGVYSTAAIKVDDDNIHLIGTNVTIPSGETLPAAIEIIAGQFGCVIDGVLVVGEPTSTTTALIKDDAFSTGRTLLGQQGPSALFHYIGHYVSSRNPYVFNSGATGAPTANEYYKGDFGLLQETDFGEPSVFRCTISGTPGTWAPVGVVPGAIATVDDLGITAATDNGKRFSNVGDAGTLTFTLPAATIGQVYHFIRIATFEVRVDPDGSEIIRGGGAGKYLSLDADGDNVSIMCIVNGSWEILSSVGTIGFES